MALDIRRTFDKHGIFYREKGPNVSRGNITINCPYCRKTTNPDPSEHMSINLQTEDYYCYRNHTHKGHGLGPLFKILGIPYTGEKLKDTSPTYTPDKKDYSAFQYFSPAEESREVLDYLEKRLFTNPEWVCKTFNLKYSPEGEWAGRLIIPMTVGWTGRSIRDHIEPRYLSHTSQSGFFFHGNRNTSAIVMEGSTDCMKFFSVTREFDVIGKCGNRLSAALLLRLVESSYESIYHLPDSDVLSSHYMKDTQVIQSYCPHSVVSTLQLTEGKKDLGAMTEREVREWKTERLTKKVVYI